THELRTPLNTILGFCQLLCRDEETTPSQQETLSIINSRGEHLLALINDVLDMSKIEADCLELNEETFNVHHLAESMRGMFRFRAEEKDLTMALEVDPNVPPFGHGGCRQAQANSHQSDRERDQVHE
ncbi:MAG: sensor histidine kinase, partial [Verrucomicrobiales bacterium]